MPTYTVLADAYNYLRKSELAGRVEHLTVRRGGTVEVDDAERASMLVEEGVLAEGEVDPDQYEQERREAQEAEATAAEEEALAPVRAAEEEAEAAAAGATTEEEAPSTRRRR